jgi:hypothetical protein
MTEFLVRRRLLELDRLNQRRAVALGYRRSSVATYSSSQSPVRLVLCVDPGSLARPVVLRATLCDDGFEFLLADSWMMSTRNPTVFSRSRTLAEPRTLLRGRASSSGRRSRRPTSHSNRLAVAQGAQAASRPGPQRPRQGRHRLREAESVQLLLTQGRTARSHPRRPSVCRREARSRPGALQSCHTAGAYCVIEVWNYSQ